MLEGAPRLRVPVSLGIVAAAMILIAYDIRPALLGNFLFVAGVIVILGCVVYGGDYIWARGVMYYQRIQKVRMQNSTSLIMESIRFMTPEQLQFAQSMQTVINWLPGQPAPVIHSISMGGTSVPFSFVKMFVALSDNQYLAPVRQWPDGSLYREYAVILTNHLIMLGYASIPRGNHSAGWIDKRGAMMCLGLMLPDGRMCDLTSLDLVNALDRANIAEVNRKAREMAPVAEDDEE
jgi:hypothetical protein